MKIQLAEGLVGYVIKTQKSSDYQTKTMVSTEETEIYHFNHNTYIHALKSYIRYTVPQIHPRVHVCQKSEK